MTTSPVMSVTDELLAELEAGSIACCKKRVPMAVNPFDLAALLAERAELKRDAERYRWLRDNDQFYGPSQNASVAYAGQYYTGSQFDSEIDAAMQSDRQCNVRHGLR